jgi:dTDP-4-amino-4,6-dideoxygalactose transaminase
MTKKIRQYRKIDQDVIHIPIHPNLTDEQVEIVIGKINKW